MCFIASFTLVTIYIPIAIVMIIIIYYYDYYFYDYNYDYYYYHYYYYFSDYFYELINNGCFYLNIADIQVHAVDAPAKSTEQDTITAAVHASEASSSSLALAVAVPTVTADELPVAQAASHSGFFEPNNISHSSICFLFLCRYMF
jgi:hypothetical protein